MMLRVLVLLCLAAAPAFGIWEKGYRVRFGMNPFAIGRTYFIPRPTTVNEAIAEGWEQVTPSLREGLEKLVMWCPVNDYTLCILYDDTGYIAGSQIAFDPNKYVGRLYDWTVAGFSPWTATIDGVVTDFYVIRQYYISAEYLTIDAAERIAARDDDFIFQEPYIYVEGFNGNLFAIPTDSDELKAYEPFTQQACMVGMGNHYYYKVTTDMECRDDTIFPWFPLEYNDQLVGLGFMWPGKYTIDDGKLNPFEDPSRAAIQLIVPRGPECLYAMGDNPGVTTMHTYFIKDGQLMTCLW